MNNSVINSEDEAEHPERPLPEHNESSKPSKFAADQGPPDSKVLQSEYCFGNNDSRMSGGS